MSRDLVIAPILTSAKQCVPPRSAPVSSRSSTANTPAHNSNNDSANSFAHVCVLQGATACCTHTSIVLDRAPLLRALPTDRHLHLGESPRTLSNPSRTSARRQLLVV